MSEERKKGNWTITYRDGISYLSRPGCKLRGPSHAHVNTGDNKNKSRPVSIIRKSTRHLAIICMYYKQKDGW
jgi:hypothetical protein